jgi:hypothetical protein
MKSKQTFKIFFSACTYEYKLLLEKEMIKDMEIFRIHFDHLLKNEEYYNYLFVFIILPN